MALLDGAPAAALERVYAEKLRLNLGAERRWPAVQAAGIQTLLVSGGFTFFTEQLRERRGWTTPMPTRWKSTPTAS